MTCRRPMSRLGHSRPSLRQTVRCTSSRAPGPRRSRTPWIRPASSEQAGRTGPVTTWSSTWVGPARAATPRSTCPHSPARTGASTSHRPRREATCPAPTESRRSGPTATSFRAGPSRSSRPGRGSPPRKSGPVHRLRARDRACRHRAHRVRPEAASLLGDRPGARFARRHDLHDHACRAVGRAREPRPTGEAAHNVTRPRPAGHQVS